MDLCRLPEELTTRILSYNYGNTSKIFSESQLPHVNVSQYTKDALEFARKPGNARLLCNTFQGCLILRSSTLFSQDLFETLAQYLEHLVIESSSEGFVFRTASECKNLKRLELKTFPTELDWTTLPEGLKAVHVTIDSKGQMTIIGDALERLQVQELGIRYNGAMDPDGISTYDEIKRVCSKIAPSHKHLNELSIESGERNETSTWDIIKHFEAVKHIVVTESMTKKARKWLLSTQSVALMTPTLRLAASLVEKVTMIDLLHTCYEDSLDIEDIAGLSVFKNLTVLRARVLGGSEKQLHVLPTEVREVQLHFTPGNQLQEGHPRHSMDPFVKITPGSLSKFVNGSNLLSRFCIYGAKVDKEEMTQLLIRFGDRLLKFGVSVDIQDQPLLFAEEILDVLAQRNPSLTELNIKCEVFEVWEGLGVTEEIWVDNDHLQRLESCLRRFHRCVPGAQVLYLISLLKRLVRARV